MPVNLTPINGTPGNDSLVGTQDDDTFNDIYQLPTDGGGEDKMSGGLGDDTYYLNSLKDVVVEAQTGGIDTVIASISYKLAAHVEKLVLNGLGNLTGTGNELANEITGNTKSNILDGGKGADLLFGGAGDDTYLFDNLGDVADESLVTVDDGGNDTIKSSVFSVTFFTDASQHEFIENFTYTGTLAWTFTGNVLNNRIIASTGKDTLDGGEGSDWLNGGKGADQLTGGDGDDTFIIDNKGDRVFEDLDGPGANAHDLVRASIAIDLNAAKLNTDQTVAFKYYDGVEDVVLTGTAALNAIGRDDESNSLTGNDGKNTLDGKSGNDTLIGRKGNDTLIGGLGDDFMDGGEGKDTLILNGGKDDYTIRLNADGTQFVRDDNASDGEDGLDRFINVETLKFADVKKGMAVPAPIEDVDVANPNVLNEEDATQNGLPAGITAEAQFAGDLPVFYSLVNPGGIFSIDSTTGVVTVEHGELLDFETSNGVYNLIVRATAEKGPALEREFAITLINKADQPADTPTIDEEFLDDTGIDDNITADTTPTISGTSTEIGGQIFIYDTFNGQTTLVATTTVLFGGTWNVTLTKLDEGVHVFKAAVQDLFGSPSALSDPLTIEIDTITPTSATNLAVTADTDSGLSNTDGITNDTTPTIGGQAPGEEGSVIHLYILNGNVLTEIGTGTVDAAGNWTAPIPSDLAPGIYDIRATIEDGAGHVGPISNGYRLIIDTNAPAAPTVTLSPASDTGTQGDGITNDTTPTLRGATEANARVHVFDGSNVEIGTAIADSTGSWSFTVSTALPAGSYTFTAKTEDVAGNLGPASGPLALTINGNNAPGAPTLDPTSDSGAAGDGITNDNTPTINVTGSGTIQLFQNGLPVVLTGGSYTPAVPLADGQYTFTITVDGITDASAALIVDIDTVAPVVSISNALAVDENAAGPFAVGTLSAIDAHSVTFVLGGADMALFTLGADGKTLIYTGGAVDFEAPKTAFNLIITATDAAANQTDQALTVNVRNRLESISVSQTNFFVQENNVSTPVATLTVDGGATLSLVGDTASFFTLVGGALSVNANLNFEDASITDADNDLSNGKQLVALVQASNGIDTILFEEVIITVIDQQETRMVSAGDSILVGGIGSDRLIGGNNSDTLIGNGGDDILVGLSGGDLLDGGEGSDTVSYVGSGAVTINLSSGEADNGAAENDGLISIENVIGSSNADTLIGDGGDNVLEGGAGDDILNGGNHGVFGDTVSFANAGVSVTVSLAETGQQNTGAGLDTISNFENIQGSNQPDTLTGNSFANVLIGGAGGDTLIGGGGSDTASYFNSTAGVIASLIAGGTVGDAAGDTFTTIENLTGSIYGDTLIGDNIANVIAGGAGHDILTGLGGADTFKYHLNPGALLSEAHSDAVTDFVAGEDKIDLSDLDLTQSGSLTFEDLLNDGALALQGNDIFADLDGGGDDLIKLFTLQNVSTETLGPTDFIL